jgi:HSP20 family protein
MKGAVAVKDETKKNGTPATTKHYPVLRSLQEDMNKLFEEFRHGFSFAPSHLFEKFDAETSFHARVDVKDTEKEVVITAELPGVDLKDIEVTMQNDGIAISGEKNVEEEEKDQGYYKMERSYGSFYRLIPLPCAIDREAVNATFKDGVLKVTMPKTAEAIKSEKKISVQSA